MDYFTNIIFFLLATSIAGLPADINSGLSNLRDFNNTTAFTQVMRSDNITIYITPAVMFVGKSNGQIFRCLYKDPSVCDVFYSHNSQTGVTAIVINGEYLYASLTGVMLRCFLETKSCTRFNNFDSSIYGLAVSVGYIHAGLQDGRMVRCELHQQNSCKNFNKLKSGITSLGATEKYIYAGSESKELWRCSVRSEDSCRRIATAAPVSQIQGIVAVEETVYGLTKGGNLWNCTRNYPCTNIGIPGSGYTSLTVFEKFFYILNSNISNCKWGAYNCTLYDQHEGALSITFAYSTFKMQGRYFNEEKTCLSERCPPYIVYYSVNERPMLEVYVKDGRLYNSQGPMDTRTADIGHSGPAAIFAMAMDGQILVSNVHNTILRSSSLFAGQPVSSVGEIVVENGVIKTIRACSNHYQPTIALNQQMIKALYMKGYTDRIESLPCSNFNEFGQEVEVQ